MQRTEQEVEERTRRGWRWVLIGALLAYSCFPLAWGMLVVEGTTPPLSGGGTGVAELALYTNDDLSERVEPLVGVRGGGLLLLSFPLSFVASGMLLRREMRRRDEQKVEERLREAQARYDAREPEIIARAVLRGRVNALQEIAQEIADEWPGADLAGGTEALRTMRHCAVVRREVSKLANEEADNLDNELLVRLVKIRGAVADCEREAQDVFGSLN